MNIIVRRILTQKVFQQAFLMTAVRGSIQTFSTQNNHNEPDSHSDFKPQAKPIAVKRPTEEVRKEIEEVYPTREQGRIIHEGCTVESNVWLFQLRSGNSQILLQKQINDYFSVDILKNQQLKEELKIYSNWPTYPQLYVNSKLVGGCDIMTEMHKDGSLKELFSQVK